VATRDVLELDIDDLRPGRYQPRLQLREESLAELAESIREQGVLQPLIVRAIAAPDADVAYALDVADAGAGSAADSTRPRTPAYEIVAGERRWRAARLAGLTTVPVLVRELDDQSALAVALIENLQREDLNPIDQARSMSRLIDEFHLTHDQIAKALGRSRASVTNFLRLLDLADDVKDAMVDGALDMGHARALLSLDADQQVATARKAVRLGWSVRQVEKTVQSLMAEPAAAAKPKRPIDLQTRWLEQQLARELGSKVAIRPLPRGDYQLQLDFGDLAKLEGSLERLLDLVRQIRTAAGPRARERAS
jgi:ParB family chromosome partitioning protein